MLSISLIASLVGEPLFGFTVAVLIAALFATSSMPKLRNLEVFEAVVADYRLVPRLLVWPVAIIVPIAELLIAIFVLVTPIRPYAMTAAAALLAIFAGAIAVNVVRGRTNVSCGCFNGDMSHRISWSLVARNLILAAVVALSVAVPATERELGMSDLLLAVINAATLFAVYATVAMIALPRPRTFDENAFGSRAAGEYQTGGER